MRLYENYNLQTYNPGLAKEWHSSKNGVLSPGEVTPFSSKKVWWECAKGHEWLGRIQSRSKGSGCPYCSGRRATKTYNLTIVRPEIAAQWHGAKNPDFGPDQVTPYSSKKVWWQCWNGHEWQATVSDRSSGYGCPFCAGKRATEEHNLSVLFPNVAAQWHPTKNGELEPKEVTPSSNRKIWWRCESGHEWKAVVGSRTKGTGCPYCYGRYASKDYNLSLINPTLAKDWHPTKNGELTPELVTPGSDKRVWWQCEKGHEWEAVICYRNKSTGCPVCAVDKLRVKKKHDLLGTHPELAEQWHPSKNKELTPDKVAPGSPRKVWWKCENGHPGRPRLRNEQTVPAAPIAPATAPARKITLKRSIPTWPNNGTPIRMRRKTQSIYPRLQEKVWWQCEHGHEWEAAILNRAHGTGCPHCFRQRLKRSKTPRN